MNDDSKSILQQIWDLIARSAKDQTRAMQRFGDLLRRVASGEIDRGQAIKEYVRLLREETTGYAGDLAKLSVRSYSSLLELNRSYIDSFFDQLSGVPKDKGSAPVAEGSSPQRVAIDLSAAPGKEAVRSFVIENKRSEAVNVSFTVSEFQDAAGAVRFSAPLQIDPSGFTLRPGEERVVTLRLGLSGDKFVPGQSYQATVAVGGYDDMVLEVTARAEMPPNPDDLTRIKGIGSGYAKRLQEAGITTFAALAAMEDQDLVGVLGDTALQRAKRDQWIAQARLGADGKQAELEALQAELSSRGLRGKGSGEQ